MGINNDHMAVLKVVNESVEISQVQAATRVIPALRGSGLTSFQSIMMGMFPGTYLLVGMLHRVKDSLNGIPVTLEG